MDAKNFPKGVIGYISPYPTVVRVEVVELSRPKLDLFLGVVPLTYRGHPHLPVSLKRRVVFF